MAYDTADEALSLFSWLKIGSGELAKTGTCLSTKINKLLHCVSLID